MAKTEQQLADLEQELNVKSEDLQKGFEALESKKEEFEKEMKQREEAFDNMVKTSEEKFKKHIEEEKAKLDSTRKTETVVVTEVKSAYHDKAQDKRDKAAKASKD